jgi:hypothetical protein
MSRQDTIDRAIGYLRSVDPTVLAGQLARTRINPDLRDPDGLAAYLAEAGAGDGLRAYGAYQTAQQVLAAAGIRP